MKTKLLISVATAALIAGTAGALAQQEEKGGAPAGAAPGAAQHQMAPGGAMHGPTPGAGAQQGSPEAARASSIRCRVVRLKSTATPPCSVAPSKLSPANPA